MSLLNSASLVVTPNAYKEGTLYSVIPNTTLGDMTVVRATTATRVNSAGLIELVPYNLMTYSEQFDNAAWTKARGSVTANATIAPNGTTTADKFVPDTQVNPHFVSQNASNLSVGGVYTSSVYAKISEWNSAAIFRSDSAVGVSFRLDTQVATVIVGSPISYSITSVGNGWFRLDVCFTAASASDGLQIRVGNNSNYSLAGNNSDGLFLWGAQLVEGSTAKDYLRTETRLNIPRLDYSNGSCPSLLVEPQRTNLALYSEQFDNAGWTKTRLTISANTSVSPDGFTSADSVFETTDNNTHLLFRRPNVTATNPFTFSCFVKANGRRRLNLQIFDSSTLFASALFDVISGVVIATNGTSKIEDYGNGWYRCAISNVSPTTSLGYAQIGLATDTYTNSNVLDSYVGDVTKGVLLYGAQFELGSYPTSYIPTTSAAVTRNADVISKTGISSLIGQTEGTLFWDINVDIISGTDSENIINIDNGSFGTTLYLIKTSVGTLGGELYNGGVVQFSSTTSITQEGRYKCALAYKTNDFALYINGVQIAIDSSGTVGAMSRLQLGQGVLGASVGNTNSAILFPTRLTNAELATLTTI